MTYTQSVQKRSSKKQGPPDLNETAFRIMQETVGETPKSEGNEKNPAAVELGRLGGLKGGKARAARLSADERTTIARNAAKARWQAEKDGKDHK